MSFFVLGSHRYDPCNCGLSFPVPVRFRVQDVRLWLWIRLLRDWDWASGPRKAFGT